MPPCRLPSPSTLFSEMHLSSSPDISEGSGLRININMPELPASGSVQLPSFNDLLQQMPESQRNLDNSPSDYRHTPRTTHARVESRWHPYSPPRGHRSTSRELTPESDGYSEDGHEPNAARTARPTYTEEEIYFIWYHKDDLGLQWPRIRDLFNHRFGHRGRDGVQGIQCRYYRALDIHGVPKSRQRDHSLPSAQFGVRVHVPDRYWSWMN